MGNKYESGIVGFVFMFEDYRGGSFHSWKQSFVLSVCEPVSIISVLVLENNEKENFILLIWIWPTKNIKDEGISYHLLRCLPEQPEYK